MGMAAGQARLLSITTRMSDNELRAQLINNDKMRLATKSAQVSEAYTTALNDAQMMFTNYDADNKTSFKELTYNALTAYNPYNNQYAISNSSGQVLVSEKDATNFKNANGNLNAFLTSYGLEYTTDYFDSLINKNIVSGEHAAIVVDGEEVVAANAPYLTYKTGLFDDDGNEIKGFITFSNTEGSLANEVNASNLVETLKNLYNGVDKIHPGYDLTKSSKDYLDYTGYLSNYTSAKNNMFEVINDKMQNELVKMKSGNLTFDDIELGLLNLSTNSNMEDAKKYLNALYNIIGSEADNSGIYKYATADGKESLNSLHKLLENNKDSNLKANWQDESLDVTVSGSTTTITSKNSQGNEDVKLIKNGLEYKMTIPKEDSSTFEVKGNVINNNIEFTYYVNNETGELSTEDQSANAEWTKCTTTVPQNLFNKPQGLSIGTNSWQLASNDVSKITDTEPNTIDNMKNVGLEILRTLQNSITNIWDIATDDGTNGPFSKFTDAKDDSKSGSFATFKDIANTFYNFIFGTSNSGNLPATTTDIIFNMDNIEQLKKSINETKNQKLIDNFKKIYDVYILDCVMNTYGEPKFTWVDQNDKNQNGEAKAQWYTNLFNRMKTGGYKTLQDGLASSTEWIKFALESGLVTLEQVDGSKNWNTTTYSNCSDITEQTNNTALTIAEAEYNAQMNKIQNKDKMYDLELKNIDTEHNSLQTEYESIKGAIDKNIERTFKIYS